MPERPASSVSFADGAEIRPLTDGDQAFVRDLYRYRDNAIVAGSLEVESADFVAAVRAMPWSTAMVLEQDREAMAVAVITSVDTHSRNGRLVLLTQAPQRCQTALGLYLRHVFWSHPLHRLYAVLPARLPQSGGYAELLHGCGFVDEGHLVAHLSWKGRRHDMAVFGLLRPEFDSWCRESRPALLLS
jgi:hypothetical protein